MKTTDDHNLSLPLKMAAAGLGGCTADIATFPFDTIKVWLQVKGENSSQSPVANANRSALKVTNAMPPGTNAVHGTKPSSSHGIQSRNASTGSGIASKLDFNELKMSEIYVRKRNAMSRNLLPKVPAIELENPYTAAIKVRANATQTFSELTVSELYMAYKKAASAAAKTSKKAADGAFQTIMGNVKKGGIRSLYSGLPAGLQRQLGFCSVRVGFYDHIKQFYLNLIPARPGSKIVGQRILAGATSGSLAVVIFQPTEVVKIRMQAEKGRYKGTFHAYKSVFNAGGVKELWKGVDANCARVAIVNVCELVTYDIVKESILKRNLMSDNVPCHFVSALIAGFVTTVVANPVDVIKTRYMNSEKGTYKNPIQCATHLVKHEGFSAFYKGFLPCYVRLGLWNLVMFISYEQYKRLFSRGISGSKEEIRNSDLAITASAGNLRAASTNDNE